MNQSSMLSMVLYPEKSLKKSSKKIEKFDDSLKKLAEEMNITMIEENGIGLAAPQIGKNIQIAIVKKGVGSNYKVYINPIITMSSKKLTSIEEGCLSVPDVYGFVERSHKIHVQYNDLEGKKHTEKAKGMAAIVLQHEIDHLNGILIVDRKIQYTKGADLLI